MSLWCKWLKSEAGTSAIELALISPIVVIMAVSAIDLGRLALAKTWTQYAAAAGAQYAVTHGFDSQSISSVVQGASSSRSVSANPSPSQYCGCPGATGIQSMPCTADCPDVGSKAGTYVVVTANYPYRAIFRPPLISYPENISSQITVRIK